MLRPKPPSNTNHPIAFPLRIKTPPIIIPAAGPFLALKLETIRLSPPMIIIGFAVYLFLINVNTVKTVYRVRCSMDEMSIPKRIHIAPVGFDQDRVVLPLKKMSAEKVYLIIEQKSEEDKGRFYVESIQKAIKKMKLNCDVEPRPSDVIVAIYFLFFTHTGQIIEKESGNKIYVNVSTGTKIHSIAGMMACMIFSSEKTNLTPYYVVPDDYNEPEDHNPFASGCKDIFPLPSDKIAKPEDKIVKSLKIID